MVAKAEKNIRKQEFQARREEIMWLEQSLMKDLQPHLELEYRVEGDEPLLVLLVGDLHIGSAATDYKELEKLRDFILNDEEITVGTGIGGEPITLNTANVRIIFLGDEIEGVKPKYLTTNVMSLTMDLQEQLNYFRDKFLKPLADAGKVIGMVSHYWGHPGWALEATTLDPWALLAESADVETILNGGRVKFVFENGQESVIETRHNPTASSKFDPLHGARESLLMQSEPIRPDGSASAHIHRLAAGKEHHAGAANSMFMVSSGTAKSTNKELPVDQFGVRLGKPYTTDNGFTSVIMTPPVGRYKKRSKRIEHTPLPSLRHASVAQRGLELLNQTEKGGITRELKEQILETFGKEPEIDIVEGESVESPAVMERIPKGKVLEKLRGNGFDEADLEREEVYSKLKINIKTELPILLQFIANARFGSDGQTEGFHKVNKFQRDYIIKNPYAVVLYLRSLLDNSAGKLPNRRQVLEKTARFISRSEDKGLALLLDSSLRNDDWKRGEDPIAPGSFLSREADIPLIHHLSQLQLFVGPEAALPYTLSVLDKLGHHGSFSKPSFGLRRNYDLYMHKKPGIVVGGHMPNAGTQMFHDGTNPETEYPTLVAPGWWARNVDTAGKGNVSPGAPPGQATILFPQEKSGDHLVYPTSSIEESNLLFDAFLLLVGLEKMGLMESVQSDKT